jgi:hypothetical protein
MTKFVYISDEYRSAWRRYIRNERGLWQDWDKSFKEEFTFKLEEEQHYLNEYSRPHAWYLNDLLGENEFLFNMSQVHGPKVEYEYTDNLPPLEDILLERALEISKMGKEIQIFYSGGIDSTAVLLAFHEVCPKDQLRIIMGGGDTAEKNNPRLYEKVVRFLSCFVTDNLYGIADPSKYVFTTGNEADRLFGSNGFTLMMRHAKRDSESKHGYIQNDESKPMESDTDSPENEEWNWNRWWGITRHTYLTQSFRLLLNIRCKKMNIENYQPLFLDKRLLQFAINLHINKEIKWYNCGDKGNEKRYLKGKMWVRDFIAKWDKDYAYSMGKSSFLSGTVQYQYLKPLPSDFNVLAITEEGNIVNRDNIMDYLTGKELTI